MELVNFITVNCNSVFHNILHFWPQNIQHIYWYFLWNIITIEFIRGRNGLFKKYDDDDDDDDVMKTWTQVGQEKWKLSRIKRMFYFANTDMNNTVNWEILAIFQALNIWQKQWNEERDLSDLITWSSNPTNFKQTAKQTKVHWIILYWKIIFNIYSQDMMYS